MQKHRISTNIGKDQKVNVELKQDFDVLEILSLKFTQEQIYTSGCADYGVVCGRVSANNGFGIPNARVSIFIPLDDKDADDPVISVLYPYKDISTKNADGFRYNLLPSRKQHGGHTPTGTFPDQTDILEREEVLEVYEKYYNYTVKTNTSGDFMIWGVPVGSHQIHVDVDLSDIGCFSLRPTDIVRSGGGGTDSYQNKYTFKSSTDLDSLPQIVTFDRTLEVYPFWGNESLCDIAITRADFDTSSMGVNIKPKAYVIGGIFTDTGKNTLKRNCTPKLNQGAKCALEAKSGRIEAVRFRQERDDNKRPYIEYVDLHEDIGDDGSFVMPIEMNLEYIITNEFGENEISNDPNKGIATAGVYRFRMSMNDQGNGRFNLNADYLLPNIREYNNNGVIDDSSYYFGSDYDKYPQDALNLILNTVDGSYYPQDYFFRFQYNKVYTMSSFHGHHYGFTWLGDKTFTNITNIVPSDEEDCSDKLTPPTNFGVRRYTFPLLIADFLMFLDYAWSLISILVLNVLVKLLDTVFEAIISIWANETTRSLRGTKNDFMADMVQKLSLINYPECQSCDEEDCEFYDVPYDNALITGWFLNDPSNTCTVIPNGDVHCFPENTGRKYVDNITDLRNYLSLGYTLDATAIYGEYGTQRPKSYYPYDNPSVAKAHGIVDGNVTGQDPMSLQVGGFLGLFPHTATFYGGQKLDFTPSARSEFKNGCYYIVPGTQTNRKVRKIINEYYRRKRVNKMFCGGIVNYAYIDNWLSGSLYFPQFQARKITRAIELGAESVIKYCRSVVRFVISQNRFYYRSAAYNVTTRAFDPTSIKRPTTFVDLGPRDEFIKEICIDPTLDPNCSISRNIGPTSYQDSGGILGLAINYRMNIAGDNGQLKMFFENYGFRKISLGSVLDGDILQLVSTNNETGIERFDLEDPKYIGYRYNVLDPEVYPEIFQKSGQWGPVPITLHLNEDGDKTRLCLNEGTHYDYYGGLVEGRLTESSQKIPFYLWDKGDTGFGPANGFKNGQSWDYNSVQVQPLQGMTYGYKFNYLPNNDGDPYLLLPMTYDNDGLVETMDLTDQINFDFVSTSPPLPSLLQDQRPGYTYLYVTGGTITAPTSGQLYVRVGSSNYNYSSGGVNIVNGSQIINWDSTKDVIIPATRDYYNSNKQILSTPFQFYFGLKAGSTGMDKFIDLYGPKGAFTSTE